MSRWSDLDDQVLERLKTGPVLKQVISAASPNSAPQKLGVTPAAIVAAIGSEDAEGEPWRVEVEDAFPFANDWVYVTVSLRAKSLDSLRDARDEVRTKLQGWEPALTVDRVMSPFECKSEVPDETAPTESLDMVWRVGVASQEGAP